MICVEANRLKALVIDDDKAFCELLDRLLTASGVEVAVADSGWRGLTLFEQNRPDIVITDLLMPDMDGVETILRIRERQRDIPILAISGGWAFPSADLLKLAARLGATETLGKPFGLAELLAAIRKCLPRSKADRLPPHEQATDAAPATGSLRAVNLC